MWASVLRPCSSQADDRYGRNASVGRNLMVPGNKWKSHSYPSSLCFGGKNTRWKGLYCRKRVQNKLSEFQPAATCQWILTMASDSGSVEARDVPMVEVKWLMGGEGNLHYKSETSCEDLACPGYTLPKKGASHPLLWARDSSVLTVMLGSFFASVSSQKAFHGKQVAKTGIKR